MKRKLLILFCGLALLAGCASAPAENRQAVRVNGEAVPESDVQEVVTLLKETYEEYGLSPEAYPSEEAIREQAVEQVARDVAVRQYIRELGLDAISDEEAKTLRAAADEAWNAYVGDYISNYSMFLDPGADDTAFRRVAEGYFGVQGYTYDGLIAELEDYCRAQHLFNRLMEGVEISQEEVAAYYDEHLRRDEELAASIPLYEQMKYLSGRTMLYVPEGYREVQRILIPVDSALRLAYTAAEDEAAAAEAEGEILARYRSATDEIFGRLRDGADFSALAEEYGGASAYPVHAESVIYPERFVAESMGLASPGEYSGPFLTPEGIYIVYYLRDVPSGASALTEEVKSVLSGELIDEQVAEKYTALADELYAKADIQRG